MWFCTFIIENCMKMKDHTCLNLDFSLDMIQECPNTCGFCNEDCSAGDLWIPAPASQLMDGTGMLHNKENSHVNKYIPLSN